MRPVSLGRFQGIDVRLHPSMLLVLVWAIYHWGYVERGGFSAIAFGITLVAAVFGLVLLHEFGHGLMARQLGLRVRDVTLLPFGGVARIEQLPADPAAEAKVSLAGPLTNLALAMLMLPLLGIIYTAQGLSISGLFDEYRLGDPSVGSFIFFLFLANLLLALVNMLPAFPMDGGRVFRAVVSSAIGRPRATKVAVAFGIAFAIIVAIVALNDGDLIIPLISLMLIAAAFAEGRAVRLEQHMSRLSVGQFAVWDRGGISPSEPLALALRDGPRDVAVTSNGVVLGMLWKSDLQRALENGRLERKAGELMDRQIITADIATSVLDVHNLMARHNQWALPITENGAYRGMFTGERFTHVYQFLRSKTPENRHVSAFTGSLTQALRGLVR